MGISGLLLVVLATLLIPSGAQCDGPPVSSATQECLSCHASIHPGIVESWQQSRHARVVPSKALEGPALSRRVSADTLPAELKDVTVGCAECHTLRPKAHRDTFDHNGYPVHVAVSPVDCATCHPVEAEQFDRNLMAHAYSNLVDNSVYQMLIQSINATPTFDKGKIVLSPAHEATNEESCLYCHGTKLSVAGRKSRATSMGDMEFPVISGWPNQGVGRINLDGSRGACSAWHARHGFSMEAARKPYTCKECHVGPDVPAMKVYEASKHGNLYATHGGEWNFEALPWTVGKDFTAPTCATCHVSLLVDTEGKTIIGRSHEMADRLPFRIFGLIYAHSHPKMPGTAVIKNKSGLQLPTDLDGTEASEFLLDAQEKDGARKRMQASCLACHDESWVDGHWARFVNTIQATNAATRTATEIMSEIWRSGLATNHTKGGNPFDEFIEKVWSDVWLFYANTVRFASAMAGGGDYGVFADGRYHLMKAVRELEDWMQSRNPQKKR